jgi:DNA polymerase
MKLTIDFETRSAITELPKTGVWPYAEHPSTDVICLALKVDDAHPVFWANPQFEFSPVLDFSRIGMEKVWELVEQADIIEAHNAEFERALWYHVLHRNYGFPDLDFFKVRCSAAKAAMHGIPRSLEKACQAMNVPAQKDKDGYRIMLKLCKPKTPTKAEWAELEEKFGSQAHFYRLKAAYFDANTDKLKAMCAEAASNWEAYGEMLLWHEDPKDMARNVEYCCQDVEAEHSLSGALDDLPPKEISHWQHDQIINMRGVPLDLELVDSALELIDEHETRLLGEMYNLTDGKISSPRQVAAGLAWLSDHGVSMENMQKQTVAATLNHLPEGKPRRFLEIRQALSKSSNSKYAAAKTMAGSDGRARSIAMYHGAGTGRFAHKGMQMGNLPQGIFENDEAIVLAVDTIKGRNLDLLTFELGDPMTVLSSAIRSTIKASPGKEFFCADYSAIEGRGLAWSAGEEWVLDAYRAYDRGEGPDLYMVAAGKILGKDPTTITPKERKNPGKIAELACGYNGGPGAIAAFGGECSEEERPVYIAALEAEGNFNPTEDDIFQKWARDVVTKWRKAHPATVALWRGLESAAIQAMQSPTNEGVAYRKFTYTKENGFLTCRLPSGRKLYYAQPELANRRMPWGDIKLCLSHMNVDGVTKKWERRFVHGGVLTENVVQALCRDILCEAMLRLENAGFPVILHVHDEIVAEVAPGSDFEAYKSIMAECPEWAEGFPIEVAGWVGQRFKKD